MSELRFNEVDVQKINLQPGEVLVVSIRSDEIDQYSMQNLSQGLKSIFKNNKVVLLAVGSEGSINLTVAKESEYPETKVDECGPGPANYCNDCSCGKKAAYEGS